MSSSTKSSTKMSAAAGSGSTNLSKKYQQKTDKQHILDNPDTYVGSVENVDADMWIFDETSKKIKEKNIHYIPALYKLFDEGIVNCRDHVIRMSQAKANGETVHEVANIEIDIKEDGTIVMYNDGNGIDIEKHPEYNIWIPELIFGHLRTSTNYNKEEEKIVGGKNGFGFKLVLIWSTYGQVETVDSVRGLKYIQTFHDNLNTIDSPKITKCKTKPFTRITFTPDYKRLGIPKLTNDMINMFKRRVYDIAAVTSKTVKVKCNGNMIPIKTFHQYVELYLESDAKKVYEMPNDRWEYAVALSPNHEYTQISFVNGIYTNKGGKHVDYITNQITRKLIAYIEKKKKITVNSAAIKEQLMVFVRCDIVNPAFDSQTKDYMNTPSSKFGSTCSVDDKSIEKIAKQLGVMDTACAISEIKESKAAKKTDGTKSKNIRGIPKLIDANWAGTPKSSQCMIILCEGDSAKAGIVSGLSSDDRNSIGVYPMKGKIMNVRGETKKKIYENNEIADIKKILGLESGKSYDTIEQVQKSLRYGKVLFMTDQDLDGSHIKGLCLNLFQSEWHSLSKINEFIGFMNTPILKAKKGSQTIVFYNDGEYDEWKESNDTKGWNVKYYKGLGTSTGKEFREYFAKKKIVWFSHNGTTSDNTIDMVFNKKRSDDRKTWLGNYDRKSFVDTNLPTIPYEDFINKELIHFSKYDCERSIPNVMDGLKISQRKILYSGFKKNLNSEIKVAQFTGYVSENSGYHHGESSLNGAIVGMAQNFVGSNNINLFQPNGQFGTRLRGGKDSASERYIYTLLSPITRKLFPQPDDNILTYLNDDGQYVEPVYYAPIIPMILVNGTKGIGTGFSTEVLCYNPSDIVEYLYRKLNMDTGLTKDWVDFVPYYEGFKGTITKVDSTKYVIKGCYEVIDDDKVRITELPVGVWTDDFKEHLEKLTDNVDKNGKKITPLVKDYDDMSKDTTVDITITLTKDKLQSMLSNTTDHGCNEFEKCFKLLSQVNTGNMHLFGPDDKLKKYDSPESIIDDYFDKRLEMYEERKEYMVKQITKELTVLKNKYRYIQANLDDDIDLRRKSKQDITTLLLEKKFDMIDDDQDFKYLTKMPMDSVTQENVEKLSRQYDDKGNELKSLNNTTVQQMWLSELKDFNLAYDEHIRQLHISINKNGDDEKGNKKVKKIKKLVKK